MPIDSKTVLHIAKLAKIDLSANEVETYTKQFADILVYVERLNELHTNDVLPTFSVLDQKTMTRDDVVIPQDDGNHKGFFVVPKVIE